MVTVAAALATVAWVVFLVWYTLRAKWWKSPIGRNTFGVSFVMFLVLLRITLIRLGVNTEAVETWGGVFVYGAAAVLGVQRTVFMEKSQREAARLRAMGYNRRKTDI